MITTAHTKPVADPRIISLLIEQELIMELPDHLIGEGLPAHYECPIAMHYVYIVECYDGTLYTGYTTDIEKRIATHNSGKGAKYTRSRIPVTLLAFWSFDSKTSALREEYRIKRLSRAQKLKLIEANNES